MAKRCELHCLSKDNRKTMKTQGLEKQANYFFQGTEVAEYSNFRSNRRQKLDLSQVWVYIPVSELLSSETSGKRLAGQRVWERSWDSRGQQSFPTQVYICKACGRKSWAQQAEICCLLWLRHKSMPLTPGHFMQDPCLYILPPSK